MVCLMTISTLFLLYLPPLQGKSGSLHCFNSQVLHWPVEEEVKLFPSADCFTNLLSTSECDLECKLYLWPRTLLWAPDSSCLVSPLAYLMHISNTSKTRFLISLLLKPCFSPVSSTSGPGTIHHWVLRPETWQLSLTPLPTSPSKPWPTPVHLNRKTIRTTTLTKAFTTCQVLLWCIENIVNSLNFHNNSMKWFCYREAHFPTVIQLLRGGISILT